MADYNVVRMVDTFLIGKDGLPKKGKTVTIELPEFDEVHSFDLENVTEESVDKAATAYLETRRKIAQLGG